MAASGTTPGLFGALPEPPAPSEPPLNQPAANFPHLWLCIGLPRLALEALDAGNAAGPVAVIDGQDRQSTVYAANPVACRHGIRPGLGLNAAYALCPQLRAEPRNPRIESARLDTLATWAGRFTPWVSVERPAMLLLEVRGSLALFGGAQSLCDRVASALEAMHHAPRLALAPTPTAAIWLSRAGRRSVIERPGNLPGQLGRLPLKCLGWPDKTVASLCGMGVYSVRDCLRLPRDGFARRFGRQYLAQLDRALGRLPDPRPSFSAPARFEKNLDMPAETADTDQLLMAAERLLNALSGYLVARQAGVLDIGLRLFHADEPATSVRIGLVEHCQDAGRLLSLLRLRLESLALPAPVLAMTLSSGIVTTLVGRERSLFDHNPYGASDWPGLIENLRNRLGVSAVFGVAGVADHRPESAWCRVRPHSAPQPPRNDPPPSPHRGEGRGGGQPPRNVPPPSPHRGEGRSGGHPPRNDHQSDAHPPHNPPPDSRPLWLLPQPQRLNTIDGRADYDGPLVCETGPERIETGWWDGADVARDYYVARNPRGLRLWIYRERRSPHDWYLHGHFG